MLRILLAAAIGMVDVWLKIREDLKIVSLTSGQRAVPVRWSRVKQNPTALAVKGNRKIN